ncbi:LPS export ABC transporter permease LptG [Geopsychrobacter electrodiphilus]|uniref:LPS export ABC transporter permease LptG n=1 Tax=Geopsychrobacter electrodiphilus TaxID=225196 RepID=UPI00037BA335|nr:LPS export ABC transporter permease LptG [Geopsychrobacter electrodiphilus]
MKQIDRYLLQHFLRIFTLTLMACVGIYLLVDFFEKASRFIEHKASMSQYLIYLINSLPLIIVQVTPLVILMGTVLTLGSLGRTNEITALRSCGISLWRIVRPLMLTVGLISIGYLLINEVLAPISTRQLTRLLDYQLQGKPEPSLNSDHIWYRDGNRIIKVALALPEKKRLQGISIFEMSNDFRLQSRTQIPEVYFREGHWWAPKAQKRTFDLNSGDLVSSTALTKKVIDFDRKPADFVRAAEQSRFKSALDLWQSRRKLSAEGFDVTRLSVDLHTRLAAPFACLIMAFLGVPFSLGRGRGSSIALGVGLSLAVGVGYFLLQSLALAFGYSGALPPVAAGWAANLIFLLLGTYLILRTQD